MGSLIGQGAILSVPDDGRHVERGFDHARIAPLLAALARSGPAVDLLVRPQNVQIASDGLIAAVASAVFLGERYLLVLRLSGGQELLAYSREKVEPGERLHVVIAHAWRLQSPEIGGFSSSPQKAR